jgi:hypothetical protein
MIGSVLPERRSIAIRCSAALTLVDTCRKKNRALDLNQSIILFLSQAVYY